MDFNSTLPKPRSLPSIILTISLITFLLMGNVTYGQYKSSLALLSKAKNDGIWLRWAPVNALNWNLGNKHGYTIERLTLQEDGEMEPGSKIMLTNSPIKPYPKERFAALSQSIDEVSVLEELIYGEEGTKFNAADMSTALSKHYELENRFGMALLMCDLSIEAAGAGALFYKDNSAQKGKRYVYRVQIAYAHPQVHLAPAVKMVSYTDEVPLSNINDLKAEFGDKTVTLSWETLLHKGIYSAYYIERSENGKHFTKLSELPYVNMSEASNMDVAYYVDSLETNQKKYFYRINGISPFAEKGPYSNLASGEGKDNLFGLLILREAKLQEGNQGDDQKGNQVKLEWEFPIEHENQIAGFKVLRANNPDGPYVPTSQKALPKGQREFIDGTPYYNTYYVLQAVDKQGIETARSFPYLCQVEDNDPPGTPIGLKGEVAKNGQVTLDWHPNTDADLLGYRVFKSHSLHEEPSEVTKSLLDSPSFTDSVSLKVLNKDLFYSVVAVDKNYNTSAYSDPLKLARPDIIAPAAPVFTKVEMQGGQIAVEWTNSASTDVDKYILSRQSKSDRYTRVLTSWQPTTEATGQLVPQQAENSGQFVDTSVEKGNTYQYILTVYDSAGNSSKVRSMEVFFETGERKAIDKVKVETDRKEKLIGFSWKNQETANKCLVYRGLNDGPVRLYQTLEGNVENFVDKQISINNTYVYKVQLVYNKGIRSQLSEEIKVVY